MPTRWIVTLAEQLYRDVGATLATPLPPAWLAHHYGCRVVYASGAFGLSGRTVTVDATQSARDVHWQIARGFAGAVAEAVSRDAAVGHELAKELVAPYELLRAVYQDGGRLTAFKRACRYAPVSLLGETLSHFLEQAEALRPQERRRA